MPRRPPLTVCLTFDLDVVEHDRELLEVVPSLEQILSRVGARATWFVRLDDQVSALRDRADHVFARHGSTIERLRASGHEVGWHPHAYILDGASGHWLQCTDPAAVAEELARHAPTARALGLAVARMGWGFHANQTFDVLEANGFAVDSSAIPRPPYPWDQSHKDWKGTPSLPYHPSCADYRVPGQPARRILEIPFSVTEVPAPYDTMPGVKRYLDPGYQADRFRTPVAGWVHSAPLLVTVSHPATLFPEAAPHGLQSRELINFERNLEFLARLAEEAHGGLEFVTLSEVAERRRAS